MQLNGAPKVLKRRYTCGFQPAISMNEPACERCGKKYYESTLEVAGDVVRCTSCEDTAKSKKRNFISRIYYRFKCEYGLTLLGRFQSLLITALFLQLLLSFVTKTAQALMFVAYLFLLCAKRIRSYCK